MSKILTTIFIVLLAVVLAVSVVLVFPIYDQYRESKKEVAILEEELKIYTAEYSTLLQEIHDLENNPSAIIAIAREKFHYQYPGETVIFYDK